jgi:MFS family permease
VDIPALRVLSYRNYRLFFGGQTISLIGTWVTRLATSWLVYRLTGSAFLLGVIGFAGQIPTFLLAPLAGVWVDRLDRRKLLIVTQVLAALQSGALAALTLTNRITLWEIAVLSALQGMINAFDMPARQAFVVEIIEDRTHLKNAIALNSSMVNVARLVGPAMAGVIVAAVGEGYCFLIDALTYLAVIYSLLAMRVEVRQVRIGAGSMLQQLREGWEYVSRFFPVRVLLLLFALGSFVGVPYTVLMPVFVSQVLHAGPSTLGLLMGAAGIGSLFSGLVLMLRRSVRGLFRVVNFAAALFGVGLIAFSLTRTIWIGVLCLMLVGFGQILQFAGTSTLIQTLLPEDKRGRVMSYWTMAFMGAVPFGSLLAGGLAHLIGAPGAVLCCGLGCLAGALWFRQQFPRLRKVIRPLYVEMGIIPAVPAEES